MQRNKNNNENINNRNFFVTDTNMTAVPLFRDTNMAAVTSRGNTLYINTLEQINKYYISIKLNCETKEIVVVFSFNLFPRPLSSISFLETQKIMSRVAELLGLRFS